MLLILSTLGKYIFMDYMISYIITFIKFPLVYRSTFCYRPGMYIGAKTGSNESHFYQTLICITVI